MGDYFRHLEVEDVATSTSGVPSLRLPRPDVAEDELPAWSWWVEAQQRCEGLRFAGTIWTGQQEERERESKFQKNELKVLEVC